jgi:4-carboxymuconolactone decarboxylase
MKILAFMLAPFAWSMAQAEGGRTQENMHMVAPALDKYKEITLLGGVWKRPGLSRRDRSLVTLSSLIARNQINELPFYLALALDNGVKPAEISETITHLAFYSGWANATSTVAAKEVFAGHNIGPDQFPSPSPTPLPLNEAAEADRAKRVGEQFGEVAPGLVQNTTDVLFRDLWLRPDLAPRDRRSLVTVSALVASGQVAQIPYHLNRAMDNGLTKEQAGETLTQLAFNVGWPNAFSALPVFKDAFEKRPR